MHYVYVLKSEREGRHYIGSSSDPERRLVEHNTGMIRSTKSRRPLVLIHKESFNTKELAEKRERFFKSGKGREVLKNIIKVMPATTTLAGPTTKNSYGEGDPPML